MTERQEGLQAACLKTAKQIIAQVGCRSPSRIPEYDVAQIIYASITQGPLAEWLAKDARETHERNRREAWLDYVEQRGWDSGDITHLAGIYGIDIALIRSEAEDKLLRAEARGEKP